MNSSTMIRTAAASVATAELSFADVKVPAENLLGEEGQRCICLVSVAEAARDFNSRRMAQTGWRGHRNWP
jgi:alkylation response protein AidB-like acyl-CoA dehydrogenase